MFYYWVFYCTTANSQIDNSSSEKSDMVKMIKNSNIKCISAKSNTINENLNNNIGNSIKNENSIIITNNNKDNKNKINGSVYELSEYLIKIFRNLNAYKFEEIIDNVLKYFNEYKEIRDKISKDDILH